MNLFWNSNWLSKVYPVAIFYTEKLKNNISTTRLNTFCSFQRIVTPMRTANRPTSIRERFLAAILCFDALSLRSIANAAITAKGYQSTYLWYLLSRSNNTLIVTEFLPAMKIIYITPWAIFHAFKLILNILDSLPLIATYSLIEITIICWLILYTTFLFYMIVFWIGTTNLYLRSHL